MKVEERILQCLEECGFTVSEDKIEGEKDSFHIVATLVALEDELDLEIPEAYLGDTLFNSFTHLCEVITNLINNKNI